MTLRPLRESLAGDRIRRVLGIVNGTTNYILSQMDSTGASFADALAEAQALGYAEADPTADVEQGRRGIAFVLTNLALRKAEAPEGARVLADTIPAKGARRPVRANPSM